MNDAAVLRSNTNRRSKMPSMTVNAQMPAPTLRSSGRRHARSATQATASAIKNGAATFMAPTTTLPDSS